MGLFFFLQLAVTPCEAESFGTNDYFASLKDFLNIDADEFEVIFSIVHRSNPMVENLSKRYHLSGQFNIPQYFHILRTKTGYVIHNAGTLEDIESRSNSSDSDTIEGVVSNSYWTIHKQLLVFDPVKMSDNDSRLGTNWWKNLASEAAHKALALGLRVRKGSIIWSGTNFSAEAARIATVPSHLRGTRAINGTVILSNSVPLGMRYNLGSHEFTVLFRYEEKPANTPRIPREVTISDPIPGSTNGNVFDVALISVVLTHFPEESTGPEQFIAAYSAGSVIHRNVDGTAAMTVRNGHEIKATAVAMGGQLTSPRHSITKWLILGILMGLFVLPFILYYKRRSDT